MKRCLDVHERLTAFLRSGPTVPPALHETYHRRVTCDVVPRFPFVTVPPCWCVELSSFPIFSYEPAASRAGHRQRELAVHLWLAPVLHGDVL
jgi:hypothetical protein